MTRVNMRGVGLASAGVLVVMVWLLGGGLATPAGEAAQAEQTRWPPQFPREGATKLFENDKVIVWDQVWVSNEYMHKHVRDILVIAVKDGRVKVTTPDGQVSENDHLSTGELPSVLGYYAAGLGPHAEVAADPANRARAFFIEFKGAEPADCKEWSLACQ